MIDGDELSIFPDQTVFLARLAAAGRQGIMNVPGTTHRHRTGLDPGDPSDADR